MLRDCSGGVVSVLRGCAGVVCCGDVLFVCCGDVFFCRMVCVLCECCGVVLGVCESVAM